MPTFNTLDDAMSSYEWRFYPDKAKGVDGIIQLVFTGSAETAYHLVIQDGSLEVVRGRHSEPTVTVTTPGTSWLAVNKGETSPLNLLMQGKLKVSGSLAMAGKFQSMFKPGSEL